jgi:hypothetical protein
MSNNQSLQSEESRFDNPEMTLADIVRMGKSQADEVQMKKLQQRKSNSAESS